MKLNAGLHLAYCTNVNSRETWAETFESLKNYTEPVRQRVCPDQPFAIGLRLTNHAAHQLADRATLLDFQRWLGRNQLYVFTLNGFAHGSVTPTQRKEQIYAPDWSSPQRLAFTNLLFDLLSQLVPEGVEGSVSTLPGSYKGFPLHADHLKAIRTNLWHCVEHVARVSEQTGRKLHIGLEPEPLCLLESSGETIQLFDRLHAEHPHDPRLGEHLGVNYDACHFAVEFEEPRNALLCLSLRGIRISKVHLSSAIKLRPTTEALQALAELADDGYLHQVVVRRANDQRFIYPEISAALAGEATEGAVAEDSTAEWRIHFHIPLHSAPRPPFDCTPEHALGVLDLLEENPGLCSHIEMEGQTWNFLPDELRARNFPDQLAAEYEWLLPQLAERGLA
ncbi:MAG TPA: metabolite traffic protein EboE [Candidatus Paceibacterota bacterium]|nr:metabolite traffic protein EboE [Candidatus Paceibacterota bacterium]